MEVYNKKILVVDEEAIIRHLLSTNLTKQGYIVFLASDGKEALEIFTKEQPNLVVLDIVLPKLDGYEVCRRIRENSKTPIIIITSLGNISDRIKGLNLGADDYIIKPFYPEELEARIYSVLRRTDNQTQLEPKKTQNILSFNGFVFDKNKQQLIKNNSIVKLTNIESSLLKLLIDNADKELARTFILRSIWGYTPERYVDMRIVDVHIFRLRSKLEEDPSNPDFILTIRGTGYLFQNE